MESNQIPNQSVIPIDIVDEMRSSYLDYSMSVIIGRALPDVRDGLKPVHRRILYAMYREGLLSTKRYSKCAGVVGEVLEKYHPHGDSAVYDALVRMAQPWNMRQPMVDGQGNFGSVDGDAAAAYRYTECRLTKLAEESMMDIDKDTVAFIPNYDDSTTEPTVLPTRVPNLLLNGSEGIAVGMATRIPPHNLGELINALVAIIDTPDLNFEQLLQHIPGPDFPTAGMICGRTGFMSAYATGRGIIQIRARTEIEPLGKSGDREAIVVTELPYQTNKAKILEHIAELVNDDKIEGISDLRDKSDRDGMRMVIELKKSANAQVVLNLLYKHTALQTSIGIIMLSIVDGRPRILPLRDMLDLFLKHRKEIITRRTLFELREAEKRAHILMGLKIAVENIDEVVALIKASANPDEAKSGLITRFGLSGIQAQAILDLRLQRLTGLERDKIVAEYNEILALIIRLKDLLSSEAKIMAVVRAELLEIRDAYANPRRTEIIASDLDGLNQEDLIKKEDMILTVSHLGYIKRTPANMYRAQKRGGKGLQGMQTRDEDFIERIFSATTHDWILIFSSKGRLYWLKVYNVPEGNRAAKGKAIANLIQMASDEKVAAILPVDKFTDDQFLMFATRLGTVKKTELSAYANPRAGGIFAITLNDDELVQVRLTDGKSEVLISTVQGQTIRFSEDEVRPMGRQAAGVRGISLADDDSVVSMDIVTPGSTILTVARRGYGKRTDLSEYRLQGRGGSGIITMKTTDKTGDVIASLEVKPEDDLMLITNKGQTIRQKVGAISVIGRNTQGVKLFNIDGDEEVVSVTLLAENEDDGSLVADGDDDAGES